MLQLETLCKELYETTDPNIRNQAEKALVNFPNVPDCLRKCQLLLERAAVSFSYTKPIHLITYVGVVDRKSEAWPVWGGHGAGELNGKTSLARNTHPI